MSERGPHIFHTGAPFGASLFFALDFADSLWYKWIKLWVVSKKRECHFSPSDLQNVIIPWDAPVSKVLFSCLCKVSNIFKNNLWTDTLPWHEECWNECCHPLTARFLISYLVFSRHACTQNLGKRTVANHSILNDTSDSLHKDARENSFSRTICAFWCLAAFAHWTRRSQSCFRSPKGNIFGHFRGSKKFAVRCNGLWESSPNVNWSWALPNREGNSGHHFASSTIGRFSSQTSDPLPGVDINSLLLQPNWQGRKKWVVVACVSRAGNRKTSGWESRILGKTRQPNRSRCFSFGCSVCTLWRSFLPAGQRQESALPVVVGSVSACCHGRRTLISKSRLLFTRTDLCHWEMWSERFAQRLHSVAFFNMHGSFVRRVGRPTRFRCSWSLDGESQQDLAAQQRVTVRSWASRVPDELQQSGSWCSCCARAWHRRCRAFLPRPYLATRPSAGVSATV